MSANVTTSETSSHDSLTTTTNTSLDATLSSGSPPTTDPPSPGRYNVIKRNGTIVSFDRDKIYHALLKAYLDVEGSQAAASSRVREKVEQYTQGAENVFVKRLPSGGNIDIEEIQDQVELAVMRAGEHQIARSYVLYREERAKERGANQVADATDEVQPVTIHITLNDGTKQPLDLSHLKLLVQESCEALDYVDESTVYNSILKNIYDGISQTDFDRALTMSTVLFIEKEPNYSYVAARLLQSCLRQEVLTCLDVGTTHTLQSGLVERYPMLLSRAITYGIQCDLLDKELQDFDLERLGAKLDGRRDYQFKYPGLQVLCDRYFMKDRQDVRFELPQVFFMRVAMGLALHEAHDQRDARAIEFYELLSSFDYMSSTPTLFNAGTTRPQLSSCYLSTIPDDLVGIYNGIRDNALLSKFAGGLGNDWTPVRAMGARIQSTNGASQGVVPFLKVANDTAVAVNQGGRRKGALCSYLETWHLDIEEFIELRKNTGDDRRRTHDMHTANWIPDLFMKRVMEGGDWTLFSPDEVSDLHDLCGLAFEKRYCEYEAMVEAGQLQKSKKVVALDLWKRMLGMLYETGHPWITFKDPCNLRSPQQHKGVVHSSNLCTEITLNTSSDEIAVCNLGSVNLPQHLTAEGQLDEDKLHKTVKTAVRMLDNVIDINYYAVRQARHANMSHRPIGLGLMGFQDALYELGIPYASEEAVAFADRSTELMSYFALQASSDLAVERGCYASYKDSLWSQGILPIDSLKILAEERGEYLEIDLSSTCDWQLLRNKIVKQGMRNSNVLAIAPTATIANIIGISQSIEPSYRNLYVKSNLSGDFTVSNTFLVRNLQQLGLWDDVMLNDLKYYEGRLDAIDRIPDALKNLYATAFEIEPRWLVEAGARRQKWLDQSQSLNLYVNNNITGDALSILYQMAWIRGLKTTYYLRSLAATSVEKSALDHKLGRDNSESEGVRHATVANVSASHSEVPPVASDDPAALCSIDDEDCEACQ